MQHARVLGRAPCVGSHGVYVVQLDSGKARIGYIVNMLPTTITTDDSVELAALDLYMLQQDGATFKATITHAPYFYLATKPRLLKEVSTFLERRFEGTAPRRSCCGTAWSLTACGGVRGRSVGVH